MGVHVTPMPRRFAAFQVIVCLLTMTSACGPRNAPVGVPVTPQPNPPQEPPSTAAKPPAPSPPVAAPAPPPEIEPANCALTDDSGEPIGTVGLSDPVVPSNAPRPSNESERVLFRQLYETLVRVDCTGRVRPGLAASWRFDASARNWIVILRENASFSDGTPVTASDVKGSWSVDAGALRPHVSRLVRSIDLVDDRTLAIALRTERSDVPMPLAHPDLAIARSIPDSPWPLGTRSVRVEPDRGTPRANAASVITLSGGAVPPLRFLVAPGDPRDLLDRGVDLLLTRDPATLDYAGTLPQFLSVPLEWQHVYVQLTPGRSRSSPMLSEDARQVLAHDAVRGEARGARGPFWWQMVEGCALASAPTREQSSPIPRIVYDTNDSVTRELAERFVGLARASGPAAAAFLDVLLPDRPKRTYQRATALNGEALVVARRRGADAGYVVSLDSRPVDPCRDLLVLMEGARWLDPETIVPLVETRLRAIVRRGRSGLTAEWDGGLVLAGREKE